MSILTFGSGLRNWWTREDSKLEAIDYDQIAALYLANTEIIIEVWKTSRGLSEQFGSLSYKNLV